MRVVIQRVRKAQVTIEENTREQIGQGILVLLGIEMTDVQADVDWLINKVLNLRIFDDENGVMNKSLLEIKGELMIVSQFTLSAVTDKGNKPSFHRAAEIDKAHFLYNSLLGRLNESEIRFQSGVFGADMDIHSVNAGPVTFSFKM